MKYCSSHEERKLILDLSTEILSKNKIKQTFFYEINPISVAFHRKFKQKVYNANRQNQIETKTKQIVSVPVQVVVLV